MINIMPKYNRMKQGLRGVFAFSLCASALLVGSCSDWDDHYEDSGVAGSDITLWEEIQQHPELSDFAEVLQKAKVFRQHKKTEASYSDIINGERSLTVFAPVNGSFDKAALLAQIATDKGDSAVENFFIKNHLSQNLYSENGTEQPMRLLNYKRVNLTPDGVNGVGFQTTNIRSKNGVLHIMKSQLPYQYTIYESLANEERFKSAGEYLASYNQDFFNEGASVSSGSINGHKVYVDSVFDERNRMMEEIGLLNAEDSTYYAAVPTESGWQKAWKEALSHFKYPSSMEKADSLQQYWAFRGLMDNAVFTRSVQASPQDSVISLHYNRAFPEYGVYYKPFATDGLFGKAAGMSPCSNGSLYYYDEWPFDPTMTYFRKIEVEAENVAQLIESQTTLCKYTPITVLGGSAPISKGKFMEIRPQTSSSQWKVTYKIDNTCSGWYNVNVIFLPKTILEGGTDTKPLRFTATVNYIDEDGTAAKKTSAVMTNDGSKIDTVTVATLKFPASNYDQHNEKVTVTIQCNIPTAAAQARNYNRIAYIDAVVLEPIIKEDEE